VSIEQAVRSMLTAGPTISLVPDARVTHGYRLQDSALPAITFEVRSVEVASCGSSPTRTADVEVRCIAELGADARAIAAQVRTASVAGTYSSIVFDAVLYQNHVLESAQPGEGDEATPSEAVCTMTIYYRE
jgi:hypothetical protein